jgi:hypothetical protein
VGFRLFCRAATDAERQMLLGSRDGDGRRTVCRSCSSKLGILRTDKLVCGRGLGRSADTIASISQSDPYNLQVAMDRSLIKKAYASCNPDLLFLKLVWMSCSLKAFLAERVILTQRAIVSNPSLFDCLLTF